MVIIICAQLNLEEKQMLSNYVEYSFLSVYAHTEAYSPMKVPKGKDSTEIHTSHNGDKQYDVHNYAILCHTWEQEEVLFHNMGRDTAKSKKGYAKLESCCRVARENGFEYV